MNDTASAFRLDAAFLTRCFDVIEHDIAPLTRSGVAAGNKIFGAAILRKSDASLVVAATNRETENPIWHGEMQAIRQFYAIEPSQRPQPKGCVVLATHEPCSLCLSGITWSGFDAFVYLFGHADSRDSFAIPHDIDILRAVYAVPDLDRAKVPLDRPLYNRVNRFWSSYALTDAIDALAAPDRDRLRARVGAVAALYDSLSRTYQARKGSTAIPLP